MRKKQPRLVQKKKRKKKMSEQKDPAPESKLPSDEQKRITIQSLRNIAGLIKTGMFLGQNAQYVREAIDFLMDTAATVEASLPALPDLKVVPEVIKDVET